jgi:hypothetical protein
MKLLRSLVCVLVCVVVCAGWGDQVVAQPPDCEDEVYAVVEGSTVTVYHDGAEYNCCPDPFEYSVTQDDSLIVVVEYEILTNPCFCICCFDLSVAIEDLAPGVYYLIFSWFNYGTEEWQEIVLDVAIPAVGQTGEPLVASVYRSDCYWGATDVPGDPPWPPEDVEVTWGLIKALYR